MQLIIHKSMGHLKTAYGPRPPAKTFAFFFGSVSLSESSFFFPLPFPLRSSASSQYSSISVGNLSVLFYSAMRQCRPTPPIIVPRGCAYPTPPTWHPAVTKHHPQNHIFTICQGREGVFFFSLSFLSLLSKDVCAASCSATCFRN